MITPPDRAIDIIYDGLMEIKNLDLSLEDTEEVAERIREILIK